MSRMFGLHSPLSPAASGAGHTLCGQTFHSSPAFQTPQEFGEKSLMASNLDTCYDVVLLYIVTLYKAVKICKASGNEKIMSYFLFQFILSPDAYYVQIVPNNFMQL